MTDINPALSTITVRENGLIGPTKKQRLSGWIKKQHTTIWCVQDTHFRFRGTHRLEIKRWEMYIMQTKHKRDGMTKLILDKIHLKKFY